MKQPTPQVTQVAAWRTQDGELFATAQEANAHAAVLDLLMARTDGERHAV